MGLSFKLLDGYGTMDWQERIVCTPGVLGGRPRVKGTRLAVSFILDLMSAGSSEEEILKGYRQLSSDDVRACLRYASESMEPPVTSEIDAWIAGVPYETHAISDPRHRRERP